jgi:hypothetical protein
LFICITPAIIIAKQSKNNKNCLNSDIKYFRLNIFINKGATSAPRAAPIGNPPISPPNILALPAD